MKELLNRILHKIAFFAPGGYTLRPQIHRLRGARIGRDVWISQYVYLDELYPEAISIADKSTVGLRTSIITHLHWGPKRSENGCKEVVIERLYQVSNGSSVASDPEVTFNYTTATGGVWHGTIGEMIADVTLADGLTVDTLLWNGSLGAGMSPKREEWHIQSPTRMQLVWKDFEPRTEPNHRGFTIARPMKPTQDE